MSESARRKKKNRSYALCVDGDTPVNYVVSWVDAPAPAAARWIRRHRLANGVPVNRRKWFARRWTMEELYGLLPTLEEAGLPINDELAGLIQEYKQDRQDATAAP